MAQLVDANLAGTDLSGAILNLARIMRADFTGANLSGASLQGLVVASGMEDQRGSSTSKHVPLPRADHRSQHSSVLPSIRFIASHVEAWPPPYGLRPSGPAP